MLPHPLESGRFRTSCIELGEPIVKVDYTKVQIQDLAHDDDVAIRQVATLLVEAFKEHWPDAWATFEEAVEEVYASFEDSHISRVAVDASGAVVGWIGGQHFYAEVWELHPMAVRTDQQGKGIGRALVADLET